MFSSWRIVSTIHLILVQHVLVLGLSKSSSLWTQEVRFDFWLHLQALTVSVSFYFLWSSLWCLIFCIFYRTSFQLLLFSVWHLLVSAIELAIPVRLIRKHSDHAHIQLQIYLHISEYIYVWIFAYSTSNRSESEISIGKNPNGQPWSTSPNCLGQARTLRNWAQSGARQVSESPRCNFETKPKPTTNHDINTHNQ